MNLLNSHSIFIVKFKKIEIICQLLQTSPWSRSFDICIGAIFNRNRRREQHHHVVSWYNVNTVISHSIFYSNSNRWRLSVNYFKQVL